MDTKIYIFFTLSVINVLLFFYMKRSGVTTFKYKFCILYFYSMFFVCGDIMLSLKSGELPPYLSLMIFAIFMLIINIIFIGMKE